MADRYEDEFEEEQKIKGKKRDAKYSAKESKRFQKLVKQKNKIKERTVDEIKERYYSVAKAILEGRGVKDHMLIKKPFNYEQEVKRKCNLEKLFLRTKDQQEKEKLLIQDMKKLE